MLFCCTGCNGFNDLLYFKKWFEWFVVLNWMMTMTCCIQFNIFIVLCIKFKDALLPVLDLMILQLVCIGFHDFNDVCIQSNNCIDFLCWIEWFVYWISWLIILLYWLYYFYLFGVELNDLNELLYWNLDLHMCFGLHGPLQTISN